MKIKTLEIYMALGEKGMTQLELAKACGLSHTTITNLLKGHKVPRMGTLIKVGNVLDRNPLSFLEVEHEKA